MANPFLSNTVLVANATYTSNWDTVDLSIGGAQNWILGWAGADQTGTLYVDQSYDGLNAYDTQSFASVANTANPFATANWYSAGLKVQLFAPFVRVRYVNGSVAQTVFLIGRRYSQD